MSILVPDKTIEMNGVKVNQYFLTVHNPNKISLPTKRTKPCIGVTLHNTNRITVSAQTTCAEQYLRATVNGNMNTVRVHFYVDEHGAWQGLPLDWQSWHAGQSGRGDANGSEAGNAQSISIECIMDGSGSAADLKARDNAAKIIAYLLDTYGGDLYTHNYWCNVRNGRKGDVDSMNRLDDGYKGCPVFIRPKWTEFKALVESYRKKQETKQMYYVQVGAFASKENAEKYLDTVKQTYPNAFIKVI